MTTALHGNDSLVVLKMEASRRANNMLSLVTQDDAHSEAILSPSFNGGLFHPNMHFARPKHKANIEFRLAVVDCVSISSFPSHQSKTTFVSPSKFLENIWDQAACGPALSAAASV